MAPVNLELTKNGKRIAVTFEYSRDDVVLLRTITGARQAKKSRLWTVPCDLEVCKELRQSFGKRIVIGPNLRQWAKDQVHLEEKMGSIANATDATLYRLPDLLPAMAAALRNYQRAGVRFLADSPNPLVADQPGLGKTWETLAAIYEAGQHKGSHLIVAPVAALETVWADTILQWCSGTVYVCDGTKAQREEAIRQFEADEDETKWLIVNPSMVSYRKESKLTKDEWDLGVKPARTAFKCKPKEWKEACKCDRLEERHWHYINPYPIVSETTWTTLIVDEAHEGAVRRPETLTAKAMYGLKAKKKFALTGTPMTKRALDLWGILHFLQPEAFPSRWAWAGRYCEIIEGPFGKKIGKLREDALPALYRSLIPYVLRRTKAEVASELPPKEYIDVWVELEGKQLKQYQSMELDGMVEIGDDTVAVTSILAEYTRLRQFTGAYCALRNGKVIPTRDSVKLRAVHQILKERGIFDGTVDPKDAEKVVIFSQFTEMVDMVADYLRDEGADVAVITGKVTRRGMRAQLQRAFQADVGPRVMVMNTKAGGVAITLDRADTVIFIDETWAYSDKEQGEDRVHRISRMHRVFIYTIRARGTIDEYVADAVFDKKDEHELVLDVRRRQLEKAA